ncbi:hypothetical protein WAK64_08505 [Bacillus spongiae]|uniref:Uncharacterized protein n=1 Tax=Bacillus spongiae TaxID=2683610 RepID=A0ABU8HD00_9BACI
MDIQHVGERERLEKLKMLLLLYTKLLAQTKNEEHRESDGTGGIKTEETILEWEEKEGGHDLGGPSNRQMSKQQEQIDNVTKKLDELSSSLATMQQTLTLLLAEKSEDGKVVKENQLEDNHYHQLIEGEPSEILESSEKVEKTKKPSKKKKKKKKKEKEKVKKTSIQPNHPLSDILQTSQQETHGHPPDYIQLQSLLNSANWTVKNNHMSQSNYQQPGFPRNTMNRKQRRQQAPLQGNNTNQRLASHAAKDIEGRQTNDRLTKEPKGYLKNDQHPVQQNIGRAVPPKVEVEKSSIHNPLRSVDSKTKNETNTTSEELPTKTGKKSILSWVKGFIQTIIIRI